MKKAKMGNNMKIAIIGGGVSGYSAAIRASQLGAEVTLVEKDSIGGTCLNRGCVPTKTLLHAGEVIDLIKHSSTFGINCDGYAIDFAAIMSRKDAVVNKLRFGVETLLKKSKVRVIKGTATLIDASTIEIVENGEKIYPEKIIIATGSKPARIDIEGVELPNTIDSDQVLELKEIPESIVIIGGGVIGVEFAQIFNRLGAKVSIIEALKQLVPSTDIEVAITLEKCLIEEGIKVFKEAKVEKISQNKKQAVVNFTQKGQKYNISADNVIMAVGRRADLSSFNVDKLGLQHKNGALVTNEFMQTELKHIYAAGDVTGGIMLAHVAIAESDCAVKHALGREICMNYKVIPNCIYTTPEVAWIGLNEEVARENYDIVVGRFPFYASGKATITNQTKGFVKIISEKKFGEILGVQIIGPRATDMISEASLGISLEMTVEELATTVHPHPTLSEAIMESAMMIRGGAIHMQ